MELSVDLLQKTGGFVGRPIEKEISWVGENEDGEAETFTATTYIRKASYAHVISSAEAARASKDQLATRIASSVCDANGKPVFTSEQIVGDPESESWGLKEEIVNALLIAISEVNGMGGEKKNSPQKESSGTT